MSPRVLARAAGLCIVAGYVDAIGYTELGGVFAANMTGNTVLVAIAAMHGQYAVALGRALTLVTFMAGALAACAARRVTKRPTDALFVGVAILTAATLLPMGPGLRLSLLALTMGLQGGSIGRFGPVNLQTVVVTGTMVRLADLLVDKMLPAGPAQDDGATRLHVLGWVTYGIGAASAMAVAMVTRWTLIGAPLVLLAVTLEDADARRRGLG